MQSIEARIRRIEESLQQAERSARKWRRAALGLLALVGLGAAAGTMAPQAIPDTLRTRRLELVGPGDKVVLLASVGDRGGQLDLWSAAGSNTVRLSCSEAGGDLALWNEARALAVSAFATADGGRVEVSRPDGSAGVMLGTRGAAAGVSIHNGGGREALYAGTADDGAGMVRVAMQGGGNAVRLGASAQGGLLEMQGAAGKAAMKVDVRDDGSGRLVVANGSGAPAVGLECASNGSGAVSCLMDGRRVAGFGCGPQGGLLNLGALDGRALVLMGAVAEGQGGGLILRGANGQSVMRAGVDVRGDGEVTVYSSSADQKKVLGIE